MQKLVFYAVVLLLFTNCTHRIVRTGYEVNNRNAGDCEIVIKRMMYVTDQFEKVGEIKLGESAVSSKCSEAHAMEILREEGCALDADVVNIIEEKRPDAWSTCYRCRAEFYRFASPGVYVRSDEAYDKEQVNKRVKNDRGKTAGMIVGIVVGLSVFFLVTAL